MHPNTPSHRLKSLSSNLFLLLFPLSRYFHHSHTGPHQSPGHPARTPALSDYPHSAKLGGLQVSLTCSRHVTVLCHTALWKASFISCLDYHIDLLVSLPLAFTFVVKCCFFLKNITCIPFFRGSLRTRNWLALTITICFFSSFHALFHCEPGGPEYAVLWHLHPLHSYLSPWNAFC